MYALFLETIAAQEIDKYVERHGGDAEEIKQKCYANAKLFKLAHTNDKSDQAWDDWWVNQCLDNDSHIRWTIDSLMCWVDTPEGHEYWAKVAGNRGW